MALRGLQPPHRSWATKTRANAGVLTRVTWAVHRRAYSLVRRPAASGTPARLRRPMEWILPAAAALIAAVLTTVIVRALSQRQLAEVRAELVEKTEQKLRDVFQSLASEALEKNQNAFLKVATLSFEAYRKPLEETLRKVDSRLQEVEHERVKAYAQLS